MRNIKFGAATLLIFLVSFTKAQQTPAFKKWEVSTGTGLFMEMSKLNILSPKVDITLATFVENPKSKKRIFFGRSTWAQFAYRWNKNYQIYAGYYHNPAKMPYNDELGLFWDIEKKWAYHSMRAGVNRIFNADGKLNYKLGVGLVYQRENYQAATYQVRMVDGKKIGVAYKAISTNTEEGGFDLNFDVAYNLSKTASIGGRFNTYYLYQLGIQGAVVSPYISVRF